MRRNDLFEATDRALPLGTKVRPLNSEYASTQGHWEFSRRVTIDRPLEDVALTGIRTIA